MKELKTDLHPKEISILLEKNNNTRRGVIRLTEPSK